MPTARAFWITAPGHGEIRDEALPLPDATDVVVRATYSGISRGTEATVFNGRVPFSERSRMRAPFQVGEFGSAVKYGYSSVGIVEQGPKDLEGRFVFVLHPHQNRYVVPAHAVYAIPDGVPGSRAVLAANMETALNGIWDAAVRAGDRVTVIGAGTIGGLVAWLAARIVGCHVELIDLDPRREQLAAAIGSSFATPDTATPNADIVIHASGSQAGLQLALQVAAFEGTVVEMSWFGDHQVSLPLGEAFHARRLTIRSSQVGSVATAQRSRWDARRRMTLALGLLEDSSLDAFISGETSFEALPADMSGILHSSDTLCHRVRYA